MHISVLALQSGPCNTGYEQRMEELSRDLDSALQKQSADLVVFPELMTVPYKSVTVDDTYFAFAESSDGPTYQWLAEKAKFYQTALVGTIFEKALIREQLYFYNTALIVNKNGEKVGQYRKTHIPKISLPTMRTDETYYFRAGNELPVFDLGAFRLGILICYDRSFPEASRALALQGADVIVIPSASSGLDRSEMWLQECAARARENHVYVIGVNRGGIESILDTDGSEINLHYYGKTCAFHPLGTPLTQALDDQPHQSLRVELDISEVQKTRQQIGFLQTYRPDLYEKYAPASEAELHRQRVRQSPIPRETEPLGFVR